MGAVATAAYKARSPELIRELDRRRKMEKRRAEGVQPMQYGKARDRYRQIASSLEFYTTEDVERWFKHSLSVGADTKLSPQEIIKLKEFKLVPNEPFRVRFQREVEMEPERLSDNLLDEARMLGLKLSFNQRNNFIDYCAYHLGLRPRTARNGVVSCPIVLDYDLAVVICKSLGFAPHEVGV